MSIKEVRLCDSCQKEIKGRLISIPCPCCKADVCMECWDRSKPSKPKDKPDGTGGLESLQPTTNQILGTFAPLPELKEMLEEKVEQEGLENLAEQETKAIKRNYHLK